MRQDPESARRKPASTILGKRHSATVQRLRHRARCRPARGPRRAAPERRGPTARGSAPRSLGRSGNSRRRASGRGATSAASELHASSAARNCADCTAWCRARGRKPEEEPCGGLVAAAATDLSAVHLARASPGQAPQFVAPRSRGTKKAQAKKASFSSLLPRTPMKVRPDSAQARFGSWWEFWSHRACCHLCLSLPRSTQLAAAPRLEEGQGAGGLA